MGTAYILSATRTAIGKFGGSMAGVPAARLGATVIEESLRRAEIDPAAVDEVIMGNVLQAGLGQNVARQAAIFAQLPQEIPAFAVNKVCGSGLKAVALAAQAIAAGDADIIVAGGTENMSAAPFLLPSARWGARLGHGEIVDSVITDGLWDKYNDCHMGITAENIAGKLSISREEQDEFSAGSQKRAGEAAASGAFDTQIVPVVIPQRKGDPIVFKADEHGRPDVTAEKLARMSPAFKKDGTVTAGNASGINDGAAALVVASESAVSKLAATPIAKITAYASAGVDPAYMGLGPVPAVRRLIEKAGWSFDDVGVFEFNEAFASQSLGVVKELGLEGRKADININGGAIALGHPIGASGARILVTLIYAMRQRNVSKGIAALCIGGGMGIAMAVETL